MLYFECVIRSGIFYGATNVPWVENQEASDLAQIASSYRFSKEKLAELIEVKKNLISNSIFPLDSSKSKLVGVEGLEGLKTQKN